MRASVGSGDAKGGGAAGPNAPRRTLSFPAKALPGSPALTSQPSSPHSSCSSSSEERTPARQGQAAGVGLHLRVGVCMHGVVGGAGKGSSTPPRPTQRGCLPPQGPSRSSRQSGQSPLCASAVCCFHLTQQLVDPQQLVLCCASYTCSTGSTLTTHAVQAVHSPSPLGSIEAKARCTSRFQSAETWSCSTQAGGHAAGAGRQARVQCVGPTACSRQPNSSAR